MVKTANELLVFISFLAEEWMEKSVHGSAHWIPVLDSVNKNMYFLNFSNSSLFPMSWFSPSSSLTWAIIKISNIFASLLLSFSPLPQNFYHFCQKDILMFPNVSRIKPELFNLECKALCELVLVYLSRFLFIALASLHTPALLALSTLSWMYHSVSPLEIAHSSVSLNSVPPSTLWSFFIFKTKILYPYVLETSFEL